MDNIYISKIHGAKIIDQELRTQVKELPYPTKDAYVYDVTLTLKDNSTIQLSFKSYNESMSYYSLWSSVYPMNNIMIVISGQTYYGFMVSGLGTLGLYKASGDLAAEVYIGNVTRLVCNNVEYDVKDTTASYMGLKMNADKVFTTF